MRIFAPIAALALALCSTTARADVEQTTLAIPTLSLTFSAAYVAYDKGFWKDEGLDVKILSIAGVGAANAVLAGSVDFANTTGSAATRAVARGQPMLAVANTLDKIQIEIVVSKAYAEKMRLSPADPPEKRLLALKGAKIAVDAPNSVVHAYVRYAARKAGMQSERDFTVAPMQPPAMMQALRTGQVDGFAMSRPWTSMARREGAVTLVSSPAGELSELNPFPYNLFVTRADFCQTKPSVCRKMLAGLQKALTYMHEQPKEAMALLRTRFDKTEPDLFEDAFKGTLASTPRTPEVKEIGFVRAQDFLVASGLITEQEKVSNLAQLYNNSWMK
ncbi:MAG: ABC transporter substrate-binding protein [Burkholderiales bacterium]|nr:ABC transporter substrate-binding protein [Burkholderiales bacterium]